KYISSFTGYFPAENPKYSCIVVIHKPKVDRGFYGADVSGPVFKDIAQKIYSTNHIINKVEGYQPQVTSITKNYNTYYAVQNEEYDSIPNVKGMAAMDAISLLENLGLKVNCLGIGKVVDQSIKPGEKIEKGKIIALEVS
ncbi:MAG TPA: PASTA domain-containing protein, partial [Flavobacteriaceae bacterium]|nr:PASTA domain-containing protein [Flavobacteriaceae bacterium]